MALSEKDLQQIIKTIEQVGKRVMSAGCKVNRKPYQETERRLRAYTILKGNIERYQKDIEDIRREDMGKSADIIMYQTNSGMAPERDLEELRREKIFALTEKIHRDAADVKEVDIALDYIKDDPYFRVIPMTYFECKPQEIVADAVHCDKSTVWRNRKRLIRQMSLVLYGADAI